MEPRQPSVDRTDLIKPIWFGGDYNPEQWPPSVWPEDIELMNSASVNMVTVGVFSWAELEPREGEYNFSWLDTVLDQLHRGGIRVDLATATASPPAWLTHDYRHVLPVNEQGQQMWPGSRQAYCPSSPVYRAKAIELVTKLVERYQKHPALEMWHINNEYGGNNGRCYCDVSAEAFRTWLRTKYGTIDALNEGWGTSFWSQRYSRFEEILPPRIAPTFKNPTQLLDFDRFSSDELIECYRAEASVIRCRSTLPITTNFMGFFKGANYFTWAKEIDVISDDCYPDPADPQSPLKAAMVRDLMRSLAGGGEWMLMEQSTSGVNWREINVAREPGQMRAMSYQALARGSSSVLFFQWRQSLIGAEKFHSAMVPHGGTNTRVWREVENLGAELAALSTEAGLFTGRHTFVATAAVVLDWDSWWAIEQPGSPGVHDYVAILTSWYNALTECGLSVDFVEAGADLSRYALVVAPALFVAPVATLANLSDFTRGGGTLVVTYQSAILDENLRVHKGGYLGQLRHTLGLWIEEFTPIPAGSRRELTGEVLGGVATATQWSENVQLGGAQVRAAWADGSGEKPAVTSQKFGTGVGWYVGADLTPDVMARLLKAVMLESRIPRDAPQAPPGVEIIARDGRLVAINHSREDVVIDLDGVDLLSAQDARRLVLPTQGVAIVEMRVAKVSTG